MPLARVFGARNRRRGRAPGGVEVAAGAGVCMGRADVQRRRSGRASGVLEWALEHGCPWSERTIGRTAAASGQLEVLKWAREHGCPWDESTCACAAAGGHLEVLQWARQQGCPWNELTCLCAAKGGYQEVHSWALAHGNCTWDEYDSTYTNTIPNGHMATVTYTRTGPGGHLEVLKWARAHDCPWAGAYTRSLFSST